MLPLTKASSLDPKLTATQRILLSFPDVYVYFSPGTHSFFSPRPKPNASFAGTTCVRLRLDVTFLNVE